MADFKTALKALGTGKLKLDVLSEQIDKLLNADIRYAEGMLSQLDEVQVAGGIEESCYLELKRQINDAVHGPAEATVLDPDEATVLDPDDVSPADSAGDAPEDDDKTLQNYDADSEDITVRTDLDASEDITVRTRLEETEDITVRTDMDASEEITVRTHLETGQDTDTGVDFDLMTGELSSTSGSGLDGAGGQEFQDEEYVPGKEFGPGDVIKYRFKLLDVLGVGGMGKVYRGIDLLKEEARDKNPYVAIKLLNDDFKSHPEAFISLQRESSRQQKLAHPNIATVYDFDRVGGKGTPVYITMELMEGSPLNTYIKKTVRKQGGLPFDEAYGVVEQLGSALSYAHARRLVHSDFKPGNAFLCNDGTVKTLDFGIARAVKNPVTGEADKTLFDPGKLGALTPAYASLEMLEGEEPDTRDDTYALGCVAYELLTGKHPFDKLPATTARENGLIPAPIKGLNKKSNRALRHALAFKREERSPTVDHFLEEFKGRPTWHKNPLTIAAAILALIGIILINPALDYLHTRKIDNMIADTNSGDRLVIEETLAELDALDKTDQARILDESKDMIQKYFAREIARQIDISTDKYNFPRANKTLQSVGEFYPETTFYLEQQASIAENRKSIESDLYQQYIAALDPSAAVEDPNIINATNDILALLRTRIDPQHPLLDDPRPANAYRLAAEQAFNDNKLEQALVLVGNGLKTAPDDVRLTDLESKIQTAITVAELNTRLSAAEITNLAEFKANEADIKKLAQLSTPAQTPVLTTLAKAMQTAINGELETVLNSTREAAEASAGQYGELLNALQLSQELTQLKLAHLAGEQRAAAVAEIADANRAAITEQLATVDLNDSQWESTLLASIRELDGLKQEDASIADELADLRATITQIYVDRANDVVSANRFDAAANYIDRAERFAPGSALINTTRNSVTQAKKEFEKQLRVKDLKEQFVVVADADKIAEANAIFEKLKAELPADDVYLTKTAPNALAESYARLAQSRSNSGDTENAYKLVQAGLALSARNPILLALQEEYRVEVNIAELGEVFKNASVFTEDEIIDIARKVSEISRGDPQRYTEFRNQSEDRLAERINALKGSDQNTAAALAAASSRMFPASSILADLARENILEPWPGVGETEAAIAAGELNRARALLDEAANTDFATHPQVAGLLRDIQKNTALANASYEKYLAAKTASGDDYNKLRQTKKLLSRAQAQWVDNPEFDTAEEDINNLIAAAPDNPARKVMLREQVNIAASSEQALLKAQADWKPVSSGRECASNLAGYGVRARAVCFDLVNTGWRGPLMVVVPTGEGFGDLFAIGKYEISVADYSKYCALTGYCKPITEKSRFNDPMTGISLADAQKYAEWLSERTGKTYRLPTQAEWEYAATAAGKQPRKDVNCRVVLGDKVLKGNGIVSIKSGKANGWGLKNYIGNVQEWIMAGDGTLAAGGSWSDAHSKCDISLQRPHNGGGDETTGFRLVLEEVDAA